MRFHEQVQGLLDSKNKLKLLAHLFGMREVEMSERELARVLGISNFSVNKLMKFFEENNLVERRRAGAATLWRLKKGSYYSELLGRVFKQLSTHPSPLEHLKNQVLSTYPLEKILEIYLYGSIAEAHEDYNSDIDIFVVAKSGVNRGEIEKANDGLRTSCLTLYGNSAQIMVMSEAEYIRKKSSALIKNIERGLKLYPREEAPSRR